MTVHIYIYIYLPVSAEMCNGQRWKGLKRIIETAYCPTGREISKSGFLSSFQHHGGTSKDLNCSISYSFACFCLFIHITQANIQITKIKKWNTERLPMVVLASNGFGVGLRGAHR